MRVPLATVIAVATLAASATHVVSGVSPLVACNFDQRSLQFQVTWPRKPDAAEDEPVPDALPASSETSMYSTGLQPDEIVINSSVPPGEAVKVERSLATLPAEVRNLRYVWSDVKGEVLFARSASKNKSKRGVLTWTEYHEGKKFAIFHEVHFTAPADSKQAVAMLFDDSRQMWIALYEGQANWARVEVVDDIPSTIPNKLATGNFLS